ncbi:severin [Tieghemostelium lacteum]|uniref:Severin n=1 Tax=Tieghemostelium lacteum TaxID=361077 RepID=A0A151ZCH1_TIELA|nr:severin [Tieghemostelium lacteum]|eukprot:KYQ91647.1 severin [Tieghemostelium lacteum]
MSNETKQSLDINQSNIAQLSSELDKKCRSDKAALEEQWKTAGKTPGLEIWRIENYKVVPWDKSQYGKFYDGDSYIILNTSDASPKHAIYFWLGQLTSTDESATAGFKATELDDFLGGDPIVGRQIQGHESDDFLALFPENTIFILNGGVESAFKHTQPEKYRPRLLHVKGKKNVTVTEVPLTYRALNSGDVFILDAGLMIIVWTGSKSSPSEKAKACSLSNAIKSDRRGLPEVTVTAESDSPAQFFKLLGGIGPVSDAAAGGSDLENDRRSRSVLCKLSDASGKLEFKEIARDKNIKRSLLDDNDVFIISTGFEIYIWVGNKASLSEKKKAFSFASEFIKTTGLPPYTPVIRFICGGDNVLFEEFFTK